jgi:tRNA-Thr(GGU) m(6)t(6)A37 methyltransferase TsaA
MDKSSFDIRTDLIRRPQGRSDMPEIGIFAQRAKHRPNPIGITSVKLIDITDNIIKVKGLDAIDNSPVLDIKPYFNHFDKINDNSMPDWINILMKDYF